MFHLVIYTNEEIKKIENHLTLFENLYDRNGLKIEKRNKRNEEIKSCNELIKKIEDNKQLNKKQLISYTYELCINENKIIFFFCNFFQLYINSENNLDLYLIEEENDEHTEKEINNNKYIHNLNYGNENVMFINKNNINNSFTKEQNIKNVKNKDIKNTENRDKIKYEKKKKKKRKKDVNLPLQRSFILFILSFPKSFTLYNFFYLLYKYIDFIVLVKIFFMQSGFSLFYKNRKNKNKEKNKTKIHISNENKNENENENEYIKREENENNEMYSSNTNNINNFNLSIEKKKQNHLKNNDINQKKTDDFYNNELFLFYKQTYNILKKEMKRKKKSEFYSALIIFKTQIYADMFYKNFHCKRLSSFFKKKSLKKKKKIYFKNLYVYCLFVNLISYISYEKENNIENIYNDSRIRGNYSNEIINNKYDYEKTNKYYLNDTKEIRKCEYLENENKTQNNLNEINYLKELYYIKKNHITNIFDINNYASFLKKFLNESNVCLSGCIMCMKLLDVEVLYVLTRNVKIIEIIKKPNYFHEYINLSCNVCLTRYLYEIVSNFNKHMYEYLKKKLKNENYFIKLLEKEYIKGNYQKQNILNISQQKKSQNVQQINHKLNKTFQKIATVNQLLNFLRCKNCDNTEDLWLCLICSFVGCGRYNKGHAKLHGNEYKHNYCMNLKTKKIWNYEQDTFVKEYKSFNDINFNNRTYSDFSYIIQNTDMNNLNEFNYEHFNEIINYENNLQFLELIYSSLPSCYTKEIYNKLFDIFCGEYFINDTIKNELLYILYSKLSQESNIYNNVIIELQHMYLNKMDLQKKTIRNINDKINKLKLQNKNIKQFINKINNAIKIKKKEKIVLKNKIEFYKNLNNNILHEKNKKSNILIKDDEDHNDEKKIKQLDDTIQNLEMQVSQMLEDV